MVELGKTYKDRISGFTGVAVARTDYLFGCVRILLTPTKLKKDGDFLPDGWFDEPQLVKAKGKTVTPPKVEGPHGSRAVAPRKDPPSRR